MELIAAGIDFILHLDRHLAALIEDYGTLIYLILFLIIFCETGLVVTPFLPGDSLLFVAGTLAATGSMDVHFLVFLLIVAAIVGDNTNYWIGRTIGPRILRERSRWLKREYLERTHRFFERHGVKTIIIARFVPIVRTFTPFVAGVGTMFYPRFLGFDIFGGVLWVGSITYLGYFFGNIPIVKDNYGLVIIGIIILSIMPGIIEYLRARRDQRTQDRGQMTASEDR
ncbi:MAG: DedA family protein [Burkholderiales bacterium]